MSEPVLVADIGGTNARFALARRAQGSATISDMRKYRAADFSSISAAAQAYLGAVGARPSSACFAVAGPVTDEQVELTNTSFVLNIADVTRALSLKQFLALNDFEALAHGVHSLTADDFAAVKPGAGDPTAPVLVIGPGTGLGQALIVPFGERRRVVPTEGGHIGFAPRTDEEIEVLQFLAREVGRVSIERILSGPGIVNIHRALCAIDGAAAPTMTADQITAAAEAGDDGLAVRTVAMFCALLGRAAGDSVLATGARGGVVLGGGILPNIRGALLRSAFVEQFLDKGRMRYYVEDAPVRLIVTDGAALLGAAARAFEAESR